MSLIARILIQGLLIGEPTARMKCNQMKLRILQLTKDEFFVGFDWASIRNQKAPFVPAPVDKKDTSYFIQQSNRLNPIKEPKTPLRYCSATSPTDNNTILSPIDDDGTKFDELVRSNSTVEYYRDKQHHDIMGTLHENEAHTDIKDFSQFSFTNFPMLLELNRTMTEANVNHETNQNLKSS